MARYFKDIRQPQSALKLFKHVPLLTLSSEMNEKAEKAIAEMERADKKTASPEAAGDNVEMHDE